MYTLIWWEIQVVWSSIITIRVRNRWNHQLIGILMGSSKNSWINAHWTKLRQICLLEEVTLESLARSMYWTSMDVQLFKIATWCLHKVIISPERQVYYPTNNYLATNSCLRLVVIEPVASITFSKVRLSTSLYQALVTQLPPISKMRTYY